MKKFEISEHMSAALDKQESNLLITTAASAVGYAFVLGVKFFTQVASDEPPLEVEFEVNLEANAPEDK